MENLQNQTETLFLPVLQERDWKEQPVKSLNPLEEDFDFERWARIVKKRMIASLNHSFLPSLEEEFVNN